MSQTPPLNLRERRRLTTELAIRDIALTLFGTQGVQATTVDQIAEQTGVSPRTFFRYFDTKESAVVPSLQLAKLRFEEAIVAVADSGSLTLADLEQAMHETFSTLVTHGDPAEADRTRAFFRLVCTDVSIRQAAGARDAQFEQWLVQRLREIVPDEDPLVLRLLAATSVAQYRAVWEHWYELDQDSDMPTPTIDELFARARGILARGFN